MQRPTCTRLNFFMIHANAAIRRLPGCTETFHRLDAQIEAYTATFHRVCKGASTPLRHTGDLTRGPQFVDPFICKPAGPILPIPSNGPSGHIPNFLLLPVAAAHGGIS